ncbi:MAG: hypothetical protein ACK47E_11770 [Cyclobacteriaceae bacterium]
MFLDFFKKRFNSISRDGLIKLEKELVKNQIISGRMLGEFNLHHRINVIKNDLQKAEFQVFSQWGDDGIIHFLTNYLDIPTRTFVEFGVESYHECNTKFLLMNSNWSGLVLDGSEHNVNLIKASDISWRNDLNAVCAFVTAENINELIRQSFTGEIGLLHIDIDGNDYWIWKTINVINPIIVIIEYNSVFGSVNPWTIPYDADFVRSNKHYSNLFYGTSLLSLCDLAVEKGYSFVGCNSNGNNAYFIRNDKVSDVKTLKPEEGFVVSKFSESRREDGSLSLLRGEQRLAAIRGQIVFNTRTKSIERI